MVAGAALSLVGITWAFGDPALTAAVMLAGVALSRTGGVTAALMVAGVVFSRTRRAATEAMATA
jgi:hypothetical protein